MAQVKFNDVLTILLNILNQATTSQATSYPNTLASIISTEVGSKLLKNGVSQYLYQLINYAKCK